MGVVADGAVAHGGKHHRHAELQLGRQLTFEVAVFVPLQLLRLLSQEHPGLHGLPEGIDGGVGHLRGVDEDLIPVDRIVFRIAHGGEQHAAGKSLLVDLPDGVAFPVGVLPQTAVGFDDLQRPGGTEENAPLAVDALALVAEHQFPLRVIGMNLVGALPGADLTADTAGIIPHHLKLRIEIVDSRHQ